MMDQANSKFLVQRRPNLLYTWSVDPVMLVLCLLGGAVFGAIIGWLLMKAKTAPELSLAAAKAAETDQAKADLAKAREERAAFETRAARIDQLESEIRDGRERLEKLIGDNNALQSQVEAERNAREEQRKLLEEAKTNLEDAFKALSSDALRKNNAQFLELAEQTLKTFNEQAKGDLEKRQQAIGELVKPIEEKLKAFDENIKGIEKERVGAYEQLKEQVKGLADSQNRLQAETNNLVRALKNPSQRGQWGEMQLETILKHAGLVEGVHYSKQVFVSGEDGAGRPDYVVSYPTGQKIVIDSKAPLEAYLAAHDASDEDIRTQKFREHARHVRQHVQALMKRAYQSRLDSVDFVVMFLPAESLYSAAVQADPALIEFGVENRVVIASPITLITLLRSVAMGWRQEQLAENAKKISDEAKELYTRFGVLGKHFSKLGDRLDGAVSAFNDTVGSLEGRVLPQARKLKELQVTTAEDLPILEPVEKTARQIQSAELKELPATSENTTVVSALVAETESCPAGAEASSPVTLFTEGTPEATA